MKLCLFADNSTETFWESGDEDRNKTKTITITANPAHTPRMAYLHIDNSRDLGVRNIHARDWSWHVAIQQAKRIFWFVVHESNTDLSFPWSFIHCGPDGIKLNDWYASRMTRCNTGLLVGTASISQGRND